MLLSYTLAMLLQVSANARPACTKLMYDYVHNEMVFTIVDDVNKALLDIDRQSSSDTGDRSIEALRRVKVDQDNEKMRQNGDRIITLMAGLGCKLPDHVTSPATYRAQITSCVPVKTPPSGTEPCEFVSREVDRLMASEPSAKTVSRKRRMKR